MTPEPHGAWPVVLTPFTPDDRPDLEALDRYVDWLLDHGASGLFPVALSGEMYELTEPERLEVAQRVATRAGGRVPVAAAVSDPGSPDEVAAAARRLADTGVDIVVLIASVVMGPDDGEDRFTDVVRHLIATHPDITLGLYECPLPYHRLVSDELLTWIAQSGRFAFFKETSHDTAVMARRVNASEGSGMRVFNAGIENYIESLALGVSGLSGWVVNVAPDLVTRLADLVASEGHSARAVELQRMLAQVESRMGPTYPGSAKAIVEARAGIGFTPRSRWRPARHRPRGGTRARRSHRGRRALSRATALWARPAIVKRGVCRRSAQTGGCVPEQSTSGWKRFWERGGLWRALLLAAVYYGVYELLSWLVELALGEYLGEPGPPHTSSSALRCRSSSRASCWSPSRRPSAG